MANFLFSWRNWIDDAATLLSASHASSSLPVDNLKNDNIKKVWRAPSTQPWVRADLGQPREIRVLAVFGLARLAATDTIRWRLGTTAGAGDVYDSTVLPCNRRRRYARSVHCLAAPLTARYIQVDFDAPSQAGSPARVDCGRLWAGAAWQGARNYSYGASQNIDDGKSRQVPSEGAPNSAIFVDRRGPAQVVEVPLEAVTESEQWDEVLESRMYAGRTRQVVYVPDPDSIYLNRAAVLGLVEASDPVKHIAHPTRGTSFAVRGPLLEE